MTADSFISKNLHVEVFDLEKENIETSIEIPDFLQEKHTSLDPHLDTTFDSTLTENELEEKFNIQPATEYEVSLLPKPAFLEKEEISELYAFAQWNNNKNSNDTPKSSEEKIIKLNTFNQRNHDNHTLSSNSDENVPKENKETVNKISHFALKNERLNHMLNQFEIEVNQLEQNLEDLKGTLASFNQGLQFPISPSNNHDDLDQIFADFDKEVRQVFPDIPLEEISISYKDNELSTNDDLSKTIDAITSPDIENINITAISTTPDISNYNMHIPTLSSQDAINHLTNFNPQEQEIEENKISLNLSEFNNIAIEEEEEEIILKHREENTEPITIELSNIQTHKVESPQEKSISEDILIALNNSIPMSSSPFTTLSKEEFTLVLKELDTLLDFLPDSKIEELAHKDFYHLYIRLMDDLGI